MHSGEPLRRPLIVTARSLLLFATLLMAVCGSSRDAGAAHWNDYQIIEWQARDAAQLAALRRIGVTAAAVIPDRENIAPSLAARVAPLRQAGLRWYIENAATDFYSAYHRWTPGRPGNWRFLDLQRRYRANMDDLTALMRDPSLSDTAWQARIAARLTAIVRQEDRYHPLFYSLGDETGIADLSAFWDFDLAPASLTGMHQWLRGQYGSLSALNAEWSTHYPTWHAVQPETTRAAMQRTDGNFAAWSDFKAWMDVAFARALHRGSDAIHAADPRALAAIEGAQMPGWGGYDYTLLGHAVDVMELYDSGENLPIVRSLDPAIVALTTSFGASLEDVHAIWREMLRGTSGLILWDDDNSIVGKDGSLGQRGLIYAALFAQLRRVAPVIMAAQPHSDAVAILYSPASFRVQWMLDHQASGDAWIAGTAEQSLEDDAWRAAMRGYTIALARLRLQPRFVSPTMLAGLQAKALILPDTLALSPQQARALAQFAARGGAVIADRVPGRFDGHGRRLARPSLDPTVVTIVAPADRTGLAAVLNRAGIASAYQLEAANDDIGSHQYRSGDQTFLALQRDAAAPVAESAMLTLPSPMRVTELLTGHDFGTTRTLALDVPGVEPRILLLQDPRKSRGQR